MGHVRAALSRSVVVAAGMFVVWLIPSAPAGRLVPPGVIEAASASTPAIPPAFAPDPPSLELQQAFLDKHFKLDAESGNYLSPRVTARMRHDAMVPVMIDNKYVKDLRGRPVFLRTSIRERLLAADTALFQDKKKHLAINYGFRSNALQQELYQKIHGTGKVAEVGGSFHEAGMALDLANWRDAQRYMIDAGFVGGCYGIEEDLVHYSINEITKASNMDAFKRCTLKEIPENILKGAKAVGKGAGKGVKAAVNKVTGR